MDLSAVLNLAPEPWRTYLAALLYAFLASQVVASAIVAALPAWAFARWRPLRALSWYAHLAPRDAAGTFKRPFSAPLDPGAMEDLERLRAASERLAAVAAEARATVAPPPPPPQSGFVRVGFMLSVSGVVLVATLAGGALAGCPRLPPVSGCTPRDYRCTDDGRPQVCSSTQRWEPIGDESCAAGGSVCVVDRTAHCAPISITATDGGTDAR